MCVNIRLFVDKIRGWSLLRIKKAARQPPFELKHVAIDVSLEKAVQVLKKVRKSSTRVRPL